MIIAVSGLHGTGKSSVSKLLAEKLDIEYYSTGDSFRKTAEEMNMTLEEFSEYVEKNPEIDKKLDLSIVERAKKGNVVAESQLSGHLLEDIADYKILLNCPLEVRVRRMAERDGTNYEEKLKETAFREKSELERFKTLYNIDLSDENRTNEVFDFIIDNQNFTKEESVNEILSLMKENENRK
jgi:cytidylate kinase